MKKLTIEKISLGLGIILSLFGVLVFLRIGFSEALIFFLPALCQVLLACLSLVVNHEDEYLKMINNKSEIEDLKQEIAQFEDAKVRSLKTDPNLLRERLYRMIDYAIGRVDWYEEQRNKFLQIGLSLLALAAGLSVLLSRLIEHVPAKVPVVTFVCASLAVTSLLFTGILIMAKYWALITPKYIHRSIADIRSWYFIYNFPRHVPVYTREEKASSIEQARSAAESYKSFLERWVEYASDKDKLLQEDLQQVFILQLLQRYRRQSLNSMKKILTGGIVIFVLLFFLTIFLFPIIRLWLI